MSSSSASRSAILAIFVIASRNKCDPRMVVCHLHVTVPQVRHAFRIWLVGSTMHGHCPERHSRHRSLPTSWMSQLDWGPSRSGAYTLSVIVQEVIEIPEHEPSLNSQPVHALLLPVTEFQRSSHQQHRVESWGLPSCRSITCLRASSLADRRCTSWRPGVDGRRDQT